MSEDPLAGLFPQEPDALSELLEKIARDAEDRELLGETDEQARHRLEVSGIVSGWFTRIQEVFVFRERLAKRIDFLRQQTTREWVLPLARFTAAQNGGSEEDVERYVEARRKSRREDLRKALQELARLDEELLTRLVERRVSGRQKPPTTVSDAVEELIATYGYLTRTEHEEVTKRRCVTSACFWLGYPLRALHRDVGIFDADDFAHALSSAMAQEDLRWLTPNRDDEEPGARVLEAAADYVCLVQRYTMDSPPSPPAGWTRREAWDRDDGDRAWKVEQLLRELRADGTPQSPGTRRILEGRAGKIRGPKDAARYLLERVSGVSASTVRDYLKMAKPPDF